MVGLILEVKERKKREKALELVYLGINDRWSKKLIKRGGIDSIVWFKAKFGLMFLSIFHHQSKFKLLNIWDSMEGVVEVLERMRTANRIKDLMLEFHE